VSLAAGRRRFQRHPGVDVEEAAVAGGPGAILDVPARLDNRRGPRLADGQHLRDAHYSVARQEGWPAAGRRLPQAELAQRGAEVFVIEIFLKISSLASTRVTIVCMNFLSKTSRKLSMLLFCA
jgi:hypothetical protein